MDQKWHYTERLRYNFSIQSLCLLGLNKESHLLSQFFPKHILRNTRIERYNILLQEKKKNYSIVKELEYHVQKKTINICNCAAKLLSHFSRVQLCATP